MARKVKCQICKKELTTDTAFKVTGGKLNKYYCSEEEYNEQQMKIIKRIECEEKIAQILEVPFLAPVMLKEINKLSEHYEYIIISKTFQESEQTIKWFLSNNEDSSEYGKTKYIMTVIRNNINKVYKKHNESIKAMEALFVKKEVKSESIDLDLMDSLTVKPNNNVADISLFLD